jgi:hypothetical protein
MMPTTPSGWYSTLALAGWKARPTRRRDGRIQRCRWRSAWRMPCTEGSSASRVSSALRPLKSAMAAISCLAAQAGFAQAFQPLPALCRRWHGVAGKGLALGGEHRLEVLSECTGARWARSWRLPGK